jgi:hypothetical protein
MIKRGNKRGLSRVAKNVTIYLLIVIIAGALFFLIKEMIAESQDFHGQGYIPTLEIVQVKKVSNSAVTVTVKENFKNDFYGVVFTVYDYENSEIGQYNLTMNQLRGRNFEIQFFLLNLSNAERLTIAPISNSIFVKQYTMSVQDEWIFSGDNDKVEMGKCVIYSQCEDNNKCTTNTCSGGFCVYPKITICKNGDECCPGGCTVTNDNNCDGSEGN